jgi:hypothetical protein
MSRKNSFDDLNQPDPKPAKSTQPKPRRFPKFSPDGFYFEIKNRRTWSPSPLGYQDLSVDDFMFRLHEDFGLSVKGKYNDCRKVVTWLQKNQWVHVATDLAGYWGPATVEFGDKRILILHSPKLIEPYEGDYPTLLEYFDGLLPGEPGEHLNCWSADVVRHVYHHELGTFIIPILCGPASAGKSLFQHLLTVATGGRSSRPYSAMIGATSFNEHLFAAEHWIIEDEYSSGDPKARAQLGTALKNFVANETKLNHGKYKMAFLMPRLLQFLTLSLNDELENIAQLPRKHPSLDDKVSLYNCLCSAMPMPTGTFEEKAAFWAQLLKELPCWIYDLLYKTPMPAKWQSGRFMVPWRAEKVSQALDELEPYMKMRDLIHILLWRNPLEDREGEALTIVAQGNSYLGTPTQIETDLRHQSSPVKTLADDLFRNPSECGRLLTRLCLEFPGEFAKQRTEKARLYLLNPPPAEEMTPADGE